MSLFWTAAASLQAIPWFERVPSAAQLADGVSRGDDADAISIGSLHLDYDYTEVWTVINRMISSGSLADHHDCAKLLAATRRQVRLHGPSALDSDGQRGTTRAGSDGFDRLLGPFEPA